MTLWARGVGMHAATSAMIRGTSLPRHLRSGAESSGSVQNPLLRGRSSNHSEPSVDTSYQPSHHSQLPPRCFALSVTTCSNPQRCPCLPVCGSISCYAGAECNEKGNEAGHCSPAGCMNRPKSDQRSHISHLTIEKSPFKSVY